MSPEVCPNCGAEVPARAKACPGCGADEQTGWSDDATADRLGIPGAKAFDHDEFVREEFGTGPGGRRRMHWIWVGVAVGVLILILLRWVF